MPRVLITTIGSYGDLHPYLAIGRVLKAEGWEVVFATPMQYREHAERLGFRHVALKPSFDDLGPEEKWIEKANDSVRGGEYVIKDFVMPYLEPNYQACYDAAEGCDLVISHLITFSAPIAAEKRGIPWLSTLLQPSVLFSAYDPPTLGPVPFLPKLKAFGPWGPRIIYRLMERATMGWFKPVIELRAKLGLPPLTANPLFRGFSPRGTIALFPEALVSRPSDWPPRVRLVGFPLFDDA
jgi:rhamnosyltransferase subunit B